MPTKSGKKRAKKTASRLREEVRRTADQLWSNYDLNWWWEFDPIRFAPPRARPFLEDARRSFLLATRELLDTWIEWSTTPRASARTAAAGRSPSRRVRIKR